MRENEDLTPFVIVKGVKKGMKSVLVWQILIGRLFDDRSERVGRHMFKASEAIFHWKIKNTEQKNKNS